MKPVALPTVKSSKALSPIGNFSLYKPLDTKSCNMPADISCNPSKPPVWNASDNLFGIPNLLAVALSTLRSNLVGANTSVAPIPAPAISAKASLKPLTSSPSASASLMLRPCSAIPTGKAKPKVV